MTTGASLITLNSLSTSTTQAQNKETHWPSYRGGSHRNGVADINAPGKPIDTRWEIGGSAEPTRYAAVVDRTAYLNLGSRIMAVGLEDRNKLWSYDAGETTRVPAVDSSSVYFGTEEGTIVSINRTTRDEEWTRIIGADVGPATVSDENVYFAGFGEEAEVVCLDKNSGDAQWRNGFSVNYPVYSEPTVTLGDESAYFTFDDTMVKMDSQNGDLIWERGSARYGPVFHDSKLYLSLHVSCYDAISGNNNWNGGSFGFGFPVVNSNHVLVRSSEVVAAFDANSGEQMWDFGLENGGTTNVSIVNNMAYVVSAGTLYGLNLSTGVARWKYEFSTEDPEDAHGLIPLSDGFLINYNDTFYMLESESADQTNITDPSGQDDSPDQEVNDPPDQEDDGPNIEIDFSDPGLLEFVSAIGSVLGGIYTYRMYRRGKKE